MIPGRLIGRKEVLYGGMSRVHAFGNVVFGRVAGCGVSDLYRVVAHSVNARQGTIDQSRDDQDQSSMRLGSNRSCGRYCGYVGRLLADVATPCSIVLNTLDPSLLCFGR